jgi:ribosomal protein S12 methylthiotransferase
MKVYLESLGCARNLVDSEIMLGLLKKGGFDIVDDPETADVIVVNTCSFITPAAQESIDTILAFAEYKKAGTLKHLIVCGCLPERYGMDMVPELPEVDLFLGTAAGTEIVRALENLKNGSDEKCFFPDPDTVNPDKAHLPRITTNPHTAYIKVAEGCSRHCTYCIIPKLRGKYRSRSREDILEEAGRLVSEGVKELILVAESTTDYGSDGEGGENLASVIREIAAIPGDFRVRLLYGFPDNFTDNIIDVLGESDKICRYFDIPIQHAVDTVLKAMGRNYTKKELAALFDRIRARCPGAALRTTLITGFPGETDKDFKELLSFIEDIAFDHLGVFTYSDSDDLPSHNLKDHVTEKKARKRHDRIMAAQAEISMGINMGHVGKCCRVLIEENPEQGTYLGRTDFQAPDVDGVTFVYAENLAVGDFVTVRITEAFEYDLAGEPA